MKRFLRAAGVSGCVALGLALPHASAQLHLLAPGCTSGCGTFSAPFEEPTIDYSSGTAPPESPPFNALKSAPGGDDVEACRADGRAVPAECNCVYDADNRPLKCKPAAGTVALLRDGRVLYFNALEGTERVEYSIFFEAGHALQNDQTRVMTLGPVPSWIEPTPYDGGATSEPTPLLPGLDNDTDDDGRRNDGALFCADVAHLAGGRVLAVGGTNYYNEPGVNEPFAFGISELEGLKNARLFDPAKNRWEQTGSMQFGRWYPSAINLASGDVFVASGVTKLLKPLYPERVEASGRNVVETETYSLCEGRWRYNGDPATRSADRTLPLFPRLHLLPNGRVLYNAAGQAFNPFGQAYDQALWNFVAAYDPESATWETVAFAGAPLTGPGAPAAPDPASVPGAGFRGSTFSIMLPLDHRNGYRQASFLTAGGVTGNLLLTSPGSNQATTHSRIDTITVDKADATGAIVGYDSRTTGPLNQARWYGTGVLLPTGDVMVFSGADRDEVQIPGSGLPIHKAELFDPAADGGKGAWRVMAEQHHPRTYHNTAMLLPDGRVLVGGHAPINTAYGYSVTLVPGATSPNDGRDPSFEIYSPPYVSAARPQITSRDLSVLRHGQEFTVTTHQAADIGDVVLMRRTDMTHLIDGDQRAVRLPFVARNAGKELRVRMPAQAAVVPPGEYMLFIVTKSKVPSVSVPVSVPGPC